MLRHGDASGMKDVGKEEEEGGGQGAGGRGHDIGVLKRTVLITVVISLDVSSVVSIQLFCSRPARTNMTNDLATALSPRQVAAGDQHQQQRQPAAVGNRTGSTGSTGNINPSKTIQVDPLAIAAEKRFLQILEGNDQY